MTRMVRGYPVLIRLAAVLLLFTVFWAVREVSGMRNAAGLVTQRRVVLDRLVVMERESLGLDRQAAVWAVGGALDLQIRAALSRAGGVHLLYSAPVSMGSYRIHKAEISMDQSDLSVFLAGLDVLQGLPLRLSRLEMDVGAAGRVTGALVFTWLERL
jgi:hypothetical protein